MTVAVRRAVFWVCVGLLCVEAAALGWLTYALWVLAALTPDLSALTGDVTGGFGLLLPVTLVATPVLIVARLGALAVSYRRHLGSISRALSAAIVVCNFFVLVLVARFGIDSMSMHLSFPYWETAAAALFLGASVALTASRLVDQSGVPATPPVAMGAVATLLATVLLTIVLPAAYSKFSCAGFRVDKAAWSADKGRLGTGHRIIACRSLAGHTRQDVETLLGRGMGHNDREWSYDLGVSGMNVEFLTLRFDHRGRVVDSRIDLD